MTRVHNIKFIALITLCTLCSCANSGSGSKAAASETTSTATADAPPQERLISAVSPVFGSKFKHGSSAEIGYQIKIGEVADSVILEVDGQRIGLIKGNYPYPISANHRAGKIPFRVTAYKAGKSDSRAGGFVVTAESPKRYGYKVVNSYIHDKSAYTQGLLWYNGVLYESTGLLGESTLRKTELSGKVLESRLLKSEYFGEGLALHLGKLYQLTWQNGKALVYDLSTMEQVGEFDYRGEGWGLTSDTEHLYMSDGTEKIRIIDPQTFRQSGTIEVYSGQTAVLYINELEWIEGEIWANIYMSDKIIRIDPTTGAVKGEIDLSGILPPAQRSSQTDVLNGIAYNKATKKIYVTGKNWPKLYEIEVIER